ncbi:MAG: ImmA/IrrE family metallo-endopeptidase [Clostridia bacterium]|nr:ImmA/IrrE family metallo-endopeptidase [Clostridia bacterium]
MKLLAGKKLYTTGSRLVHRFHTRDPFEIADALGIKIILCSIAPMKGMYRVILRNRFIFIDNSLTDEMKRIVCAHEIGHDQLHRSLAKGDGIQEFMLYDMRHTAEYEANLVAAEILLDEDEITEYIMEYGYTTEQTAHAMHTDINLLTLKISTMIERGYDFRSQDSKADFLK